MYTRSVQLAAVLLIATLYWIAICEVAHAREPWDARRYWSLWYPTSIAISAVFGFHLREGGWQVGVIVTGAQLPVMCLYACTGPLVMLGVVMVLVLALPAAAASLLGSLAAQHRR